MPKILTLGLLIATAGGVRLRMQTMRSTMTKRRRWKRKTERPNVVAVSVLDISYASPKGGRLPAYLATNGLNMCPGAYLFVAHRDVGQQRICRA
jgi:hypothetical protein